MSWIKDLHYDPIKPLLASQHTAIIYWTKRDLLQETMPETKDILWGLPIPRSIIKRQNQDGSWPYPGRRAWHSVDYDQLETYRQLGFLIEMFGFDHQHPSVAKAAEYIFSCQSNEGDFRGIYANQYSPNYTAALLELLVKAGYASDERVLRAFDWLENVRQDDGGWALPLRTQGCNLEVIYNNSAQLSLDRNQPFSHLVTGVVLRAFAAHPEYRNSHTAKNATQLLVSRFFERDVYPDRNLKDDWIRFSFPFWQTDILSSLDIVGLVEPSLATDKKVLNSKQWFVEHQEPSGLFGGHLLKDRYHDLQLWYSYAICRALEQVYY